MEDDREIPHTYTPEEQEKLNNMMKDALDAQGFYLGDIDQLERDVDEMRRKKGIKR